MTLKKEIDLTQNPIMECLKQNLCIGCGFCSVDKKTSKPAYKISYSEAKDSFCPSAVDSLNTSPSVICPGIHVDLNGLVINKFGEPPKNPLLGPFKEIGVFQTTNSLFSANASSGGVIPTILEYLFESKKIDVAYCVTGGSNWMDAKGICLYSKNDLSQIHGSIYHPTDFGFSLSELIAQKKRFAFVGLPCHLMGLEMLKKDISTLASFHVFSIGLFCGGINTFNGIAFYLKAFGILKESIAQIKYRVGNWPGKILVSLKEGTPKIIPRIRGNTRWKILRYVISFQGYWMLKRCRICPDQLSDLADISVGDPHSKKYRDKGGHGFSAVIIRTLTAQEIIHELLAQEKLKKEDISVEELIQTQGSTLDNRRHVVAYLKLNSFFGGTNPYVCTYNNFMLEAKPRHYIAAFCDLVKIYVPVKIIPEFLLFSWQIFEYLFLTLTPRLLLDRLLKVVTNK